MTKRLFLLFILFSCSLGQATFSSDCALAQVGRPDATLAWESLFNLPIPKSQLRHHVLKIIDNQQGPALANWARESLRSGSSAQLGKMFQYGAYRPEVGMLGGGVHAAIFASNFVDRDPTLFGKVLVGERTSQTGSANYTAINLGINSGTPPRIVPGHYQPNRFPNAVISPEEFSQRKIDFPNSRFIADTAAISLRAENVVVKEGFNADRLYVTSEGLVAVRTAAGEIMIPNRFLILSNGFGGTKIDKFDPESQRLILDQKEKLDKGEVVQVLDYRDQLKLANRDGKVELGDKIAVLGGKHGGAVAIEEILRTRHGRNIEIHWFDQPARTGKEFLGSLLPGGGDTSRPLFAERYSRHGIPEAFGKIIVPHKEQVTHLESVPGGKVQLNTRLGGLDMGQYTGVVLATGANSAADEILRASQLNYRESIIYGPASIEWTHYNDMPLAKRILIPGTSSEAAEVYVIGPAANLSPPKAWMSQTITGSPQSINATGGLTAAFGRWARQNYRAKRGYLASGLKGTTPTWVASHSRPRTSEALAEAFPFLKLETLRRLVPRWGETWDVLSRDPKFQEAVAAAVDELDSLPIEKRIAFYEYVLTFPPSLWGNYTNAQTKVLREMIRYKRFPEVMASARRVISQKYSHFLRAPLNEIVNQ